MLFAAAIDCWKAVVSQSAFHFPQECHIGGVMVNMIVSSIVDHEFEPRSSQTKDYKIWYLLVLW